MGKMLCSGDGHLVEPWDLWTTGLPKSFRHRFTGYQRVAERTQRTIVDDRVFMDHQVWEYPDGSEIEADPDRRVHTLEADGIWAETLIPNDAGWAVLAAKDPEYAMACARVYNDYVAEAYLPNRPRQLPIAIIPARDTEMALAEVERIARLELPGIALPIIPPQPYHLDIYEPIWAAAAAHGLPVSFHVATGLYHDEVSTPAAGPRMLMLSDDSSIADDRAVDAMRTSVGGLTPMTTGSVVPAAQSVIGNLVGAGVLERFPELHIVIVEAGAGWLAYTMEAMDSAWVVCPTAATYRGGFAGFMPGTWKYPLKPSEYVRRQVHCTFIREATPVKTRELTGVDPLIWGADYPHPEGTWPKSREVTASLSAGLDSGEREALFGGNLARLYHIAVPEASDSVAADA